MRTRKEWFCWNIWKFR